MKKIRLLTFMLVIAGIAFSACSQSNGSGSKVSTVTIKVSAKCEMCKARIEKALAYEKGIKKAEVDLKTKTIVVTYYSSKTNPDKIRLAINNAGYDADGKPATKEAYDKLPPCCKKDTQ